MHKVCFLCWFSAPTATNTTQHTSSTNTILETFSGLKQPQTTAIQCQNVCRVNPITWWLGGLAKLDLQLLLKETGMYLATG